ncbi:uncharacterized protein LOC107035538 [Diachasma alloeum]|uniref:uncharacterized protein LOC107035538 n=1 Tax=Diachasma alloeum TaxID=454923 RepID=UPI0007384A42|nr:uncharacterized protein LOC107035538 [Diachasma alloeum]
MKVLLLFVLALAVVSVLCAPHHEESYDGGVVIRHDRGNLKNSWRRAEWYPGRSSSSSEESDEFDSSDSSEEDFRGRKNPQGDEGIEWPAKSLPGKRLPSPPSGHDAEHGKGEGADTGHGKTHEANTEQNTPDDTTI